MKKQQKSVLSLFKEKMLTTREASHYLNLCVPYVRQLASKGKIISYKPGGKNLYFDTEDLNNYLRTNRRMSEAEISTYALKFNRKHNNTAF